MSNNINEIDKEPNEYDQDDPIEYFYPCEFNLEILVESPNLYDILIQENPDTIFSIKSFYYKDKNKNNKMNEIWKGKRDIFLEKIQKETVQFYECVFIKDFVMFCDLEDKTFFGYIRENARRIRLYVSVKCVTMGICELLGTSSIHQYCACDDCIDHIIGGYNVKYNMEITHRRFIDEIQYLLSETLL